MLTQTNLLRPMYVKQSEVMKRLCEIGLTSCHCCTYKTARPHIVFNCADATEVRSTVQARQEQCNNRNISSTSQSISCKAQFFGRNCVIGRTLTLMCILFIRHFSERVWCEATQRNLWTLGIRNLICHDFCHLLVTSCRCERMALWKTIGARWNL